MPGGPGPHKTLERQESGTRHALLARLVQQPLPAGAPSDMGLMGRPGLAVRARIKPQIPVRVAHSESDSGLFSLRNHRT
jgi:hypothetical protein